MAELKVELGSSYAQWWFYYNIIATHFTRPSAFSGETDCLGLNIGSTTPVTSQSNEVMHKGIEHSSWHILNAQ